MTPWPFDGGQRELKVYMSLLLKRLLGDGGPPAQLGLERLLLGETMSLVRLLLAGEERLQRLLLVRVLGVLARPLTLAFGLCLNLRVW